MPGTILTDIADRLQRYKYGGRKYEQAAQRIYEVRFRPTDPFSPDYVPYIVDGLEAFDMNLRKQLWEDKAERQCFAQRLQRKLGCVEQWLSDIVEARLHDIELSEQEDRIVQAYDSLSQGGPGSLYGDEKQFHVGATKTLHWIAPRLFIMIDQHTARALQTQHGVDYRDRPPQGYTAEKYLQCLTHAQKEIAKYGPERLSEHEPGTPLVRIFDKVAWVLGKQLA